MQGTGAVHSFAPVREVDTLVCVSLLHHRDTLVGEQGVCRTEAESLFT